MALYRNETDIGRAFMRCTNPKSSVLVEPIDKSVVETTVKTYFESQMTETGKAKARLLQLYYLSDTKVKLKTVGEKLGYSLRSIKRFHSEALSEVVPYIPPQYRA